MLFKEIEIDKSYPNDQGCNCSLLFPWLIYLIKSLVLSIQNLEIALKLLTAIHHFCVISKKTIFGQLPPYLSILYVQLLFNTRIKLVMWPQRPAS